MRLDNQASEVERLHDGAKMFRAVREMTRKPASKLRIQDDSGRVICNAAELNERATQHFGQQFSNPRVMELPAFTGVPSPLTMPITPVEVQRAISKLNSGRASGHDDLPADLLKSTADLIAPLIAAIFYDALEHHEPLDIGKGVLILLQKPGKPVGPLTSVRPIVLLSALRKTLSLVVLSRIATKVDNFLSPSQSGFRRERSTADVVFGYRWLCAKAQRQRMTIEFLCIDLSRAFDTIRRDKLLEVLQSFLDEPELRMIRFLLAATSLEPRLSDGIYHEHLIFGNSQVLCASLASLYTGILSTAYVPNIFTTGVIIPVIKKSTLDPNVVKNYRPITISSVHTKAIESFIIPSAEISDNQFGFRESRGTAFACNLLNDVTSYCKSRNSPLFLATLDAEKCFDSICHVSLFLKLIDVLPTYQWLLLYNWYRKLNAVVKWNGCYSNMFGITREANFLHIYLIYLLINCY